MHLISCLALVALSVACVRCQGSGNLSQVFEAHPRLSNISAILQSYPSSSLDLNILSNGTFCAPTNDAITRLLTSTEAVELTNQADFEIFVKYHALLRWIPSQTSAIVDTILHDGNGSTMGVSGAVIKYQAQTRSLLSGLGQESAIGVGVLH